MYTVVAHSIYVCVCTKHRMTHAGSRPFHCGCESVKMCWCDEGSGDDDRPDLEGCPGPWH